MLEVTKWWHWKEASQQLSCFKLNSARNVPRDLMIRYLRKRPLKAVYFTSSQELTQPRCIHKMETAMLLQGDQLYSHRCWKNLLAVRGRSSCSAYGKCRNWSETWGLSRQNRHRLPEDYDCKENTCNGKKNTHIYIMYIRRYWVGRIHCLPTQCGQLPTLPPRFPRPCRLNGAQKGQTQLYPHISPTWPPKHTETELGILWIWFCSLSNTLNNLFNK